MRIDQYVEDTPDVHWPELTQPLNLYTYSNVYDDYMYGQLKNTIVSQLENYSKITYKTHGTTFNHNDKKLYVVSHQQNNRLQQVLFDFSFIKNYWHQTSDTVYDWAWNELHHTIHPLLYYHLTTFKNQVPHGDDLSCWVPFRCHINYLEYSRYLFTHLDMMDQVFNTPIGQMARARTLTFYLHDYVEGQGGELYTHNGYVYKPKQNEAVSINGNAVLHGVNANMNSSKEPRLAFSVRWVHKDDLYLPGHPDKSMYTQNLLD